MLITGLPHGDDLVRLEQNTDVYPFFHLFACSRQNIPVPNHNPKGAQHLSYLQQPPSSHIHLHRTSPPTKPLSQRSYTTLIGPPHDHPCRRPEYSQKPPYPKLHQYCLFLQSLTLRLILRLKRFFVYPFNAIIIVTIMISAHPYPAYLHLHTHTCTFIPCTYTFTARIRSCVKPVFALNPDSSPSFEVVMA